MDYEKTEQNSVRRIPERGHYDQQTIFEILDDGFLCHVSFVIDGKPFQIPTLYGREDDAIYLHGSPASRMLRHLRTGAPACLSVTHVDGLVLARSALHHSMNYRSAVVFGTAVQVADEDKEHGLFVISENVLRGRWNEARPPSEKELRMTSVLKLTIESASAKIRDEPPHDEDEDYALPHWAGVVPIRPTFGAPIDDPKLRDSIDVPPSVIRQVHQSADRLPADTPVAPGS